MTSDSTPWVFDSYEGLRLTRLMWRHGLKQRCGAVEVWSEVEGTHLTAFSTMASGFFLHFEASSNREPYFYGYINCLVRPSLASHVMGQLCLGPTQIIWNHLHIFKVPL